MLKSSIQLSSKFTDISRRTSTGMATKNPGILSPEQISSFHERGVLKIDFSFDPDLLDNIVEKVYPYYSEEYRRGETVGARIQDAWKFIDEVRLLAVHKDVKTALAQLLGRKALPFQTINFPVGTGAKTSFGYITF